MKDPERCLQEAERRENQMYLEACLQQRRHFYPFVALVDGLLEVEATATLKRLASRLATKWKQLYSKTYGYVKSRIAITLVRTTHRSEMFVLMKPRVARVVESMHQAKYRRDPTISWRRVLSGAERVRRRVDGCS